MDKFSLLAATALILAVFAVAFLTASHQIKRANYWRSWTIANLITSAAELGFVFEDRLPELLIYLLPNGLLVAAFTLYGLGARQFDNKPTDYARLFLPLPAFLVIGVASYLQSDYSQVYIGTNAILAFLALDSAYEYWREREDGLTSRYGLVFSFGLMGTSFFSRAIQGISLQGQMAPGLIDDTMLTLHIMAALIVITTAGAFALALAYEKQAEDHREEARRDPLTGAFNRREFKRRLLQLLQSGNRAPFALVQFDLDHFKSINDRYGHSAGDEVLQTCSDVMQWHLREEDLFARVGGEEFVALMPDIDYKKAVEIAEKIRKTVSDVPLTFSSGNVRMTLSAGLYHGAGEDGDFEKVLKIADEALYASKKSGRNQVSIASKVAV